MAQSLAAETGIEPGTEYPGQAASAPVVLTVVEPGRVFIGEEEVAFGDLVARLKAHGISPRDRIFLRTDGNVTYGAVMRVMGGLAATGFKKVDLITTKSDPAN